MVRYRLWIEHNICMSSCCQAAQEILLEKTSSVRGERAKRDEPLPRPDGVSVPGFTLQPNFKSSSFGVLALIWSLAVRNRLGVRRMPSYREPNSSPPVHAPP